MGNFGSIKMRIEYVSNYVVYKRKKMKEKKLKEKE
jgi:hypothetical protein